MRILVIRWTKLPMAATPPLPLTRSPVARETLGIDVVGNCDERSSRNGPSRQRTCGGGLTPFAHKKDWRRPLLSGFQVHVLKPIDPHDLTAVIATLDERAG
jgi:hypothetical protein